MGKDRIITARVPEALAKRLEKAISVKSNPFAPTRTAIILRGLELALKEVERR